MEYSKIAHHDHNVRGTNVGGSIMNAITSKLSTINTIDQFIEVIEQYQQYLPVCPKNYLSITKFPGTYKKYIALAYLLMFDQRIMKAHPFLGGEYKRIIESIKPYISEDFRSIFEYRSEEIIKLCYRLEQNSSIKNDEKYHQRLNTMNTNTTFLINTINEFIVTHILQLQNKKEQMFIASNMDDKNFGFDAIQINEPIKKITLIDYTVTDAEFQKKIKNLSGLITFQHKQRDLRNTELFHYLSQKNKLLTDYTLEASILLINRTQYYDHIIPIYIEYFINFGDEEQFRNTIANTTFYIEHIITSCTSP